MGAIVRAWAVKVSRLCIQCITRLALHDCATGLVRVWANGCHYGRALDTSSQLAFLPPHSVNRHYAGSRGAGADRLGDEMTVLCLVHSSEKISKAPSCF